MSDAPTITQALAAVMNEIDAVGKEDRNTQQNYSFRGVDAVVNAVGPALRKHSVLMVPHAGTPIEDHYQSKSGAAMTRIVLPVTFTFHGPAGDTIDCLVYGESSDSGDKAMPKAHSVAWRVAMLQVFAIPTDDPDPDLSSHERAAEQPEATAPRLAAIIVRKDALPDEKRQKLDAWVGKKVFSDAEGWDYADIAQEGWWDQIEGLLDKAESAVPPPVESTPDPGRPFEEEEK